MKKFAYIEMQRKHKNELRKLRADCAHREAMRHWDGDIHTPETIKTTCVYCGKLLSTGEWKEIQMNLDVIFNE